MDGQFLSSSGSNNTGNNNNNNFDPTGLLTYLINENDESGPSIVPIDIVPQTTSSSPSCLSAMMHNQDPQHHSPHAASGYNSNHSSSLPNNNNSRNNNTGHGGQQSSYHGHQHQQSMSHGQHHHQQQHMSHHSQQHSQHSSQHARSQYSPTSGHHGHHQQMQQRLNNNHEHSNSNPYAHHSSSSHSSSSSHRQHAQSSQFSPNFALGSNASSQQVLYTSPTSSSSTATSSSQQQQQQQRSSFNNNSSFDTNRLEVPSSTRTNVSNSSQVSLSTSPTAASKELFPDHSITSEIGHHNRKDNNLNVIITEPMASSLPPLLTESRQQTLKREQLSPLVSKATESINSPGKDSSKAVVKTPNHRGPGRPRKIRPPESGGDPKSPKSADSSHRRSTSKDHHPDGTTQSIMAGMAEKKTIIVVKIIDQVILDGKVVKETENEQKFERSGGLVYWAGGDSSNSDSINKSKSTLPRSSLPSATVTSSQSSSSIGTKKERNVSGTMSTTSSKPPALIPSPPKLKDVLSAASSGFKQSALLSTVPSPKSVQEPSSSSSSRSHSRDRSGVERTRERRRKENKRNSDTPRSKSDAKRNRGHSPGSKTTRTVSQDSIDTSMDVSKDDDDAEENTNTEDEERMREEAAVSTLLALSSPEKCESRTTSTDSRKSIKSEGTSSRPTDTSTNRTTDTAVKVEIDTIEEAESAESIKLSNYDFNNLTFDTLRVGSSVMAKWSDKNFYAGKLMKSMGDYKWNILFEDGGRKVVHESDILSIPYLTIGQIVMITFSGQGLCLRGCIKDVSIEESNKKQTMYYHVEYTVDSSKIVVDKFFRGDVFLTAELAAALLSRQSKSIVHQPDSNAKFADVDLNNIIPKRSRISAQSQIVQTTTTKQSDSGIDGKRMLDVSTDNDSETEDSSSNDKKKGKKITTKSVPLLIHSPKVSTSKITVEDTTSQSSTHSSTSSSTGLGKAAKSDSTSSSVAQNLIRDSGRPTEESSNKNNSNTSSRNVPEVPFANSLASSLDPEEIVTILGPIPEEGSDLFQGTAFLLTTADAAGQKASDAESGRSTAPFDIYYLMKQIESGGGRVYQNLGEAQNAPDCKEIVLLAYTYLRTVKYMQCLAAGIPCLMHTWIIDSCRQKRLLSKDDYLLPSGFSITTNSLPSDRMVFKKSSQLFKGVRFMLVSKNQRHSESWTPVLNAANAIVVDDLPSSPGTATRKASNSVDVIISDVSCPSSVLKKAKQLKIPVVSSEYVVQCLINGKRLPCDAHEKFNISYKS